MTRAVDGVVGGAPLEPGSEWVTQDELGGAWIQLSWPAPVRISQINLFDRPYPTENVLSGSLTFSDGTSLGVGALQRDGRAGPITFPAKTVTWVRFTVEPGGRERDGPGGVPGARGAGQRDGQQRPALPVWTGRGRRDDTCLPEHANRGRCL